MAKSSRKKPVRKASGTSSRKKGATKKSSSAKKSSARKKTASKKTTTKKKTQRAAKPAGGAKKKAATNSTAKSTRRSTKKAAASSTRKSQEASDATAPKAAPTPTETTSATSGKKGPKGITVVTPKPTRKESSRVKMPETEPLIKPGGKWKPLIPSGPSAAPAAAADGEDNGGRKKQRLNKRELEKYRKILLAKREELLGDITNMEDEALRGSGSGSLSHTPQHMAEQGSDAYDQALSLDLAQVDRNLLKEIDEALKRIDDGTYGFCELTGRRIRNERLEELPWTRYSIEAARERERRSYR